MQALAHAGGGVGPGRGALDAPVAVLDVEGVAHRRQAAEDLGHLLAAVDLLAAVAVAAGHQQHDRLDLLEAVDHAARAELQRAGGPYRPEAGRGEEGDQRLGTVREVAGDPVAASYTEVDQQPARAGDLLAQRAPGQVEVRAGLRAGEHRGRVVRGPGTPQRVLGVVEQRAAEPLGPRHHPLHEHRRALAVVGDLEELPDRGPEALQVVDRPAPQVLVVAQVEVAVRAQPVQEPPDLALRVRVGGPDDVTGAHRHRSVTFSARPSRKACIRSLASSVPCAIAAIMASMK